MRQVLDFDDSQRRDLTPNKILAVGLRYPAQRGGSCFFVTSTFKDWAPFGETEGFYEALAESLNFYSRKYMSSIAGYVFMPTNIHLVIFIDGKELGNFMRDFKKFTGQHVRRELKLGSPNIWMPRYDRVELNSDDIFREKIEYIHNNPVKSGLVGSANDWFWSSAADYMGREDGPLVIWKEWG